MARKITGYIKYLTYDEFKLVERYINLHTNKSMQMCIKVMMYLGLRVSEAVSLKKENFNADYTLLTYKLKKSDRIKDRRVPEFLAKELKAFSTYRDYNREKDFLFYSKFNDHVQPSGVRYFFVRMRKRLSLDQVYYTCKDGKKLYRVSPHTLRHYAIYRYYKASGNDIIKAQQIIGHKEFKTTAKYINSLESKNDELQIIEKAFN